MAVLEPRLGIKLFAAPMMASGIIFFSPPSPPDPTGFLVGTAGAATVAAASLTAASYLGLGAPVGAGAAAGALLMWYKATGTIFPPAAVLCMLMASAVASAPAGGAAGWGWKFVVTPWVSGHAFLWASAFAVGGVRGAVRCAFVSCVCAHGRLGLHFHAHTLSHTLSHKHTHTHTHRHTHTRTRTHAHTHTHLHKTPADRHELGKQQMRTLGASAAERIKATFNKYDTSKDGTLDAVELKVLACALASGSVGHAQLKCVPCCSPRQPARWRSRYM